MYEPAFPDFPIPERQTKPRTLGLTMMIDWGMGLARQNDTVESAGEFIDFAKIAAGIARFMPRDLLHAKLASYKAAGISTSPGGLFAELALKMGRYDRFVDEVVQTGFTGIEVSDNLLKLEARDKAAAIALAKSKGLTVFGEVGRKEGSMDDASLVQDVANCLDAGADWVFLEASELFAGTEVRLALIAELARRFPPTKLIYELPVVIIPGVSRDYKHKICSLLVKELGTEVNLANLEWDELYITELVRRGFAGDTSHPQGAYRLAGFDPAE
ncbi:phosphosulfolactate synthase [Pseudacidovorax sp. RU35E]|uniref:phosphosulfolactate synthase n=1 Tax=Pseudacidovorax sp. RU35E TaxID=1907403 RepID=UPI000955A4D0|nr:phosphosulfolactate synthase [Pseudacidovorax sp. RU35E]SIQ54679.1 phosphosulfolactate synthase [Pseudacidovorax sp. RU35E]